MLALVVVLVFMKYAMRSDTRHVYAKSKAYQKCHGFPNNTVTNFVIKLAEIDTLFYQLKGYTFNQTGKDKLVEVNASVRFLHSFYPTLERDIASKFVVPRRHSPGIMPIRKNKTIDTTKENVISCISPALQWFDGRLKLACRLCLQGADHSKISSNHFIENYIYTPSYDEHLNAVGTAHVLGILIHIKNGPEDPRMFEFQNNLYLTYNAYLMFPETKEKLYTNLIYDFLKDLTHIPYIAEKKVVGKDVFRGRVPEKNWMVLTVDNTLFFGRTLDPFSVVKCSIKGKCTLGYPERLNMYVIGRLRGGTPFEHYSDNYFITFAHSMSSRRRLNPVTKWPYHIYKAHIIVIHTEPFRIVYVSYGLLLPKSIFQNAPMAYRTMRYIEDDFFFPVSSLYESDDKVVIGGHVNDHSSILLRMSGIKQLMEKVINADLKGKCCNDWASTWLH